jgi:hypothetical protein
MTVSMACKPQLPFSVEFEQWSAASRGAAKTEQPDGRHPCEQEGKMDVLGAQ